MNMALLHAYGVAAEHRALVAALCIALGYALSFFIAHSWMQSLCRYGRGLIATLGTRLDRSHRSVATRVYRGIIVVLLLLIPAMVIPALLDRHLPTSRYLFAVMAVFWFGHCFWTGQTFRAWRQARAGKLPLELASIDYLFVDHHGVIRYLVAQRMEAFARGIVGVCFWYVLAGLPGAFAYSCLAADAAEYTSSAFGWAARHLFRLVDFAPNLIARALLAVAGIFVSGTHPLRALRSGSFSGFIAELFGLALGGVSPLGNRPWVGKGTAKAEPRALYQLLALSLAATWLLILLLCLPQLGESLANIKHLFVI